MEWKQIIEKLQLRGKQIVLLPFVRVSEEIIQTDGKMNDPSAEVTCWLAFSSAISLFANHYPWHTLLFYPSIKMREGGKRAREKERERWMHLVTVTSLGVQVDVRPSAILLLNILNDILIPRYPQLVETDRTPLPNNTHNLTLLVEMMPGCYSL